MQILPSHSNESRMDQSYSVGSHTTEEAARHFTLITFLTASVAFSVLCTCNIFAMEGRSGSRIHFVKDLEQLAGFLTVLNSKQ